MFDCTLHFSIDDNRMPRVKNCTLHIQLNDVLMHIIKIDPKPFFTIKSTSKMLETILLELGRRKLMNTASTRIPASVCNEIFELIRDDPCLKTLSDHIDLDTTFKLSPLFRTSYCDPRLNIFFSIHA